MSLANLVLIFYVCVAFFTFVVLGAVCRISGLSSWRFLKYIKDKIFFVLGTASSENALSRLLQKLENFSAPSRASVWSCLPVMPSTLMARLYVALRAVHRQCVRRTDELGTTAGHHRYHAGGFEGCSSGFFRQFRGVRRHGDSDRSIASGRLGTAIRGIPMHVHALRRR